MRRRWSDDKSGGRDRHARFEFDGFLMRGRAHPLHVCERFFGEQFVDGRGGSGGVHDVRVVGVQLAVRLCVVRVDLLRPRAAGRDSADAVGDAAWKVFASAMADYDEQSNLFVD